MPVSDRAAGSGPAAAKCKACASHNVCDFIAEINIHIDNDPDNAGLFIFPKVRVCLDCGLGDFQIPEPQLSLVKGGSRDVA